MYMLLYNIWALLQNYTIKAIAIVQCKRTLQLKFYVATNNTIG